MRSIGLDIPKKFDEQKVESQITEYLGEHGFTLIRFLTVSAKNVRKGKVSEEDLSLCMSGVLTLAAYLNRRKNEGPDEDNKNE
jgi:hypothetical protein